MTKFLYVGLSCTLPEELQIDLVRTIPGLEKADVLRPGNFLIPLLI